MLKLAFYKWLTSLSHGDGQSRGIKAATFARQAAGDSPVGTISDLSDWKKISSKSLKFAEHHWLCPCSVPWPRHVPGKALSSSLIGNKSIRIVQLMPAWLLLLTFDNDPVSVQHGHLTSPESTARCHRYFFVGRSLRLTKILKHMLWTWWIN